MAEQSSFPPLFPQSELWVRFRSEEELRIQHSRLPIILCTVLSMTWNSADSWTCSGLWSWSWSLSHVLRLRIFCYKMSQSQSSPAEAQSSLTSSLIASLCVRLFTSFCRSEYIRPTTAGVNTAKCWGGGDQHRDGQERWRDRSEIQLILFVWELSSAIITTRRSSAYIMEILTAEYEKCRHYWRVEIGTRWV